MRLNSELYNVYFGSESLPLIGKAIVDNKYSNVFILCDNNTEELCLPHFIESSELESAGILIIEAGENSKTMETISDMCQSLLTENADRKTLLINLGGGVVCDVGGFSASIYNRGIDFINVPTTLLAMVDASIGGKTGVNLNNVKNAVGVFAAPHSVYIDAAFLNTLDEDEFKSGFAEIIKHALIVDEKYWQLISSITDLMVIENLISIIHRSVEIKLSISSQDFRDTGFRKILNFGHTFGHAYESSSFKSEGRQLKHGHAVAIGMIGELFLSAKLAGFPAEKLEQVVDFIILHFGKSFISINENELVHYLFSDKKNEKGKVGFYLLSDIGRGAGMFFPDDDMIHEALKFTSSIINE